MTIEEARRYLDARVRDRCDGKRMAWSLIDVEAIRAILSELRRIGPLVRR